MDYAPRLADTSIAELFAAVAALSVAGPKAVGKTATLRRLCETYLPLDDPSTRQRIAADPTVVAMLPRPVFVDEWQHVPDTWHAIRRAADDDLRPKQFLLAGSASPTDSLKLNSGAGRIVTWRLRPMSLAERGLGSPTVSHAELAAGSCPPITGHTPLTTADYCAEIATSGFPGIRQAGAKGRAAYLTSYLDRVAQHDVRQADITVRKPAAPLAWLRAYAAASATTTSYTSLVAAANPGAGDLPGKSAADSYRTALEKLWLLDPVPAWIPVANLLKELGQAPKLHLADPALALSALGLSAAQLASPIGKGAALLGPLFESLVTQSLRVYAQQSGFRIAHLRLHGGTHEIDLLVEKPDGTIVAFEVKAGAKLGASAGKHLTWLQQQFGDLVTDRVIVTAGPDAYRRADGIAVVPLALLGP